MDMELTQDLLDILNEEERPVEDEEDEEHYEDEGDFVQVVKILKSQLNICLKLSYLPFNEIQTSFKLTELTLINVLWKEN